MMERDELADIASRASDAGLMNALAVYRWLHGVLANGPAADMAETAYSVIRAEQDRRKRGRKAE